MQGQVFVRIGPFSVRRGRVVPEIICYCWHDEPFMESQATSVCFMGRGRWLALGYFAGIGLGILSGPLLPLEPVDLDLTVA